MIPTDRGIIRCTDIKPVEGRTWRQGYLERSQKAAKKRRQELEESYKKQRKMV